MDSVFGNIVDGASDVDEGVIPDDPVLCIMTIYSTGIVVRRGTRGVFKQAPFHDSVVAGAGHVARIVGYLDQLLVGIVDMKVPHHYIVDIDLQLYGMIGDPAEGYI